MRTIEEIKKEFSKRGISISSWAASHGFSSGLVYQILSGKRIPQRGQSHKIAVLLGLKEGSISDINDLPFGKLNKDDEK